MNTRTHTHTHTGAQLGSLGTYEFEFSSWCQFEECDWVVVPPPLQLLERELRMFIFVTGDGCICCLPAAPSSRRLLFRETDGNTIIFAFVITAAEEIVQSC